MSSPPHPDRPVATFFLLAFGVTWLAGLAVAAILQAVLPESLDRVSLLLGKYGPTIAGLIMAFVVSGRSGVRHLVYSAVRMRANPIWYVIALLVPPLIWWAALLLYQASGGGVDWSAPVSVAPAAALSSLATFLFLGGGLGEELGWRGFALPVLQRRMTALRASLVIGPVWAAWHLPAYLFDDGDGTSPIWLFTLFVLSATVFLTWLYNSTRVNVLMAVLFHASFNASEDLLEGVVPVTAEAALEMWMVGLYLLVAVIIIVAFRGSSLSWLPKTVWPDAVDSPVDSR